MSENIIDKNLSRIVKIKLSVEGIKNIEDIQEICIQDINLMQKKNNIDLTEIDKLKNLKSLSLKFFEITDKVIDSINNLEFIEEIEFAMCTFNTKKILSRNIKSLTLYNCTDFNIDTINSNIQLEELKLIHSGLVNISKLNHWKNLKILKLSDCNIISIKNISVFENLEKLYLNNTNLPDEIDISNMKRLKLISLNGADVKDKENYIQKLYKQNKSLHIEFKENNLPIE